MLRPTEKQLSFYSLLYDKIPQNHILKVIDAAIDFRFVNDIVADSYCCNFGRLAKEPEMMAKLLFLERLYDLSDERVIQEGNFNLAFLWFLGLNPEDTLPDPSLLAKFCTQRLNEVMLDDILTEIVRQCVEKGIIKGDGLSIDTTHIAANLFKKEPCTTCPYRETCIGKGKKDKARKLNVSTAVPLFYEKSQEQKQPEFQEKYKKRAAQEWKNAEMKRFHGMARAKGWGLRSVSFQAKLTAIAVNLKRIAALVKFSTPPAQAPVQSAQRQVVWIDIPIFHALFHRKTLILY